MTTVRCKLTIAFPPDLEDDIVECLLELPEDVGGFSVVSAEGHGHGFARASVRERVRGRVARKLRYAILEQERLPTVLSRLRDTVRSPSVAYWVEPVIDFGRLTS